MRKSKFSPTQIVSILKEYENGKTAEEVCRVKGIILSAGFRHTKERTPAGNMGKVEGVKSKLTGIGGELALRWKPVKGKQFYEVETQAMEVMPPRPILPSDPPTTPPAAEVLRQEWKMTATSARNRCCSSSIANRRQRR